MKIIVFGDKQTVLFFRLAGIEGKVIENSEEANEELKKIRKNRSYGLIIVTEQIVQWAEEIVTQIRFSRELPLIIDIPSSTGKMEGIKSLSDYIRENIGVKI